MPIHELKEIETNHPSSTPNDHKIVWFAMSAPYRRELKAKAFLDSRNIECFVPMKQDVVEKRCGIKSKELVPAIHNLIFVRTSKEKIKALKQGVDFLQYRTMPSNGKNRPIIVPDRDMAQFIAVTKASNDGIIYLRPEEIDLEKGTKVRVHGGTFDGAEGYFVKIKGKRNRKVVLLIENVAAIALADISADLIEVLSQEEKRTTKFGKSEPK